MQLRCEPLELKTKHTFRISREAHDEYHNVLTLVTHEEYVGIGEASPSGHFGECQESVLDMLSQASTFLGDDPFQIERILDDLKCVPGLQKAAETSIDIALHDVLGKRLEIPLYKLFGLEKEEACRTSFTIGIDSIDVIREKVKEASEFPIMKIKLGTDYDTEILKTVREESDAILRVDANGAWSPEEAVDKIHLCQEFGVEFVEEPVSSDNLDGLSFVKERAPVPIIADESVLIARDIPKLAGCVDGINIKLMKCGGLREALRMIHVARAHDMSVMLGCRIESSISITAAAHLSPLVDYADLDGNLLLANDPYMGVQVREGKLLLPDGPGLGVIQREKCGERS